MIKAGLLFRLARLESPDAPDRQHAHVIWLGLDGEPETPLADLDPERPVLYLPRKAPSVEAWTAMVRQRFPQYGGRDDAP
jgi:hypothetical protein